MKEHSPNHDAYLEGKFEGWNDVNCFQPSRLSSISEGEYISKGVSISKDVSLYVDKLWGSRYLGLNKIG
jgi:hypothetical protein